MTQRVGVYVLYAEIPGLALELYGTPKTKTKVKQSKSSWSIILEKCVCGLNHMQYHLVTVSLGSQHSITQELALSLQSGICSAVSVCLHLKCSREGLEWVGHLPQMWPTRVLSLASPISPLSLSGTMSKCRARNKP